MGGTAAGGGGRPLGTVVLVLATPLLARLSPTRLTRALAWAIAVPGRRGSSRSAQVRVERAIGIAARFRTQTCLTRGIARYLVLRRAGLAVELVFGLGSLQGSFSGHCWLELDGLPQLEEIDPRPLFPEVLRIPAAGAGA